MGRDEIRQSLNELLDNSLLQLNQKKFYIWGTGNTAELYQEGLKRLSEEGFHVEGYCDNNSSKWGKNFGDKRIVSPSELVKDENICVLICSPQEKVVATIGKQLDELGVEWYPIDEIIFKFHREEIMSTYDLLEDTKSKKVYKEIIECRMKVRFPKKKRISKDQYFTLSYFKRKSAQEVFVDCGSFVGDSIEKYFWERDGVFKKIIAFEPDSSNFEAMKNRVDRLKKEWNIGNEKIELYPYGVGEKEDIGIVERYGNNNGLGSKMKQINSDGNAKSETQCKIIALDEFLNEPISFIKADIESYEYKMLLGATRLIEQYMPQLAICIYHNAVDIYSIPLLVKSIVPEYKLAIRHHSTDMADTVLYAWCE